MKDSKIDKKNVEDMLGLTSMQEGMLFHYLSNPASKQYFEQIRLQLSGKIDSRHFKEAWRIVAQTNEMLHAVIRWEKLQEPVQIVLKNKEIPIFVHDLSGEKKETQKILLDNIIKEDKNKPVDLTRDPLRINLCILKDHQSQMIITFHHILIDGWSTGILLTGFLEAINRLLKGEKIEPVRKTKYKEFFKWYQGFQSQSTQQQQEFWKNYLEGFDTRTLLPYDKNKLTDIQQVNTHKIEISSSLKEQLELCGREHNVTIAALLYTAWGILLQKYNNSDDIIFGTTVSGRTPVLKGIDQIVGLFINTLPLRLKADKNNTLSEILHLIGNHLEKRNEYGYEHSSLTTIKQLTGIGKDSNLFDSIIVIDNYPLDNILTQQNLTQPPGDSLVIDSYDIFEMTNFDLTLQIMLIDMGHMRVDFHYNADLFLAETIQRMVNHYVNILKGIINSSASGKISQMRMLSQEETKQILEGFNKPYIDFRVDKTIHGVIEAQAAQIPDNSAVRFEDQWFTYREFNEKANQLAHLLKEYGVRAGSDSRVVMMFPRSIDMIIALLGILKAGAACIPLDISYPGERNRFIVRDSNAKFLLTSIPGSIDTGKSSRVTEVCYKPETLDAYPGENPGNSISPADLSYIIYTSGSTGKPKGALLHHSGVVNHTYTKIDVLGITGKDTVVNNFSINVIASVWQILSPLFTSARLVLYSEEIEWDPYLQFRCVAADGVTVIEVIPSVLKAYLFILDEGKEKIPLKGLRKIALTSEETKPVLVNKFYKIYTHIDLVDCYGQTECCDDVLHYTIPHDTDTRKVAIGTPSLNTRVLILNHHDQLQPVGAAGEICVIGAGVAYGYWKRPELTAEKFCLRQPGGRFLKKLPPWTPRKNFLLKEIDGNKSYCLSYRTGDLGRWLADGKVEFLGRIDHQVKIRGNRVELREIENHLLRHPAVNEAAVVAKEDREGENNLYAFFIADEEITASHIRQFLLKTLPDYMIPAHFVPMEKLPLTPNGKIDRKVLVKMETGESIDTGIEYQPPRNSIEIKIRDIWTQLLDKKVEQVGIHDNFFDLGGHSLLLIKLKSKLENNFDLSKEIGITELFNYPTIAHQAQYIEENLKVKEEASKKSNKNETKPSIYHDKLAQDTRGPSPNKSFCGGPGGGFLEKSPLAVIGISLQIPGAANIHEFWQNIINGTESISFFEEEELEGSEVENYIKGNLHLVPAGGIIGDIDLFDADFFGFNPREAEVIEPQQRLFLEHAWQALEDAGYGAVGDTFTGTVGVYAGVGLNTYLLNNVMAQPQVVNTLGEFQTMIGNDKDFLATRTAYKLNLKGPAITLQTACSTSLVAIHLARQGLLNGDCHMALVGGVAVHVPEKTGYFYNEGGYLSPNGHCRAFDAEANGTVFGNGIGVVVLKPLVQAIDDNDHIYAVVKSSAINNDGSLKVGYTSPSEVGQAAVILRALREADISPDTIGYIEAHGTGTVLGDPVEMAALKRAYQEAAGNDHLKNQYCAIGSVKSNIGHLDIAAGIIGFIKAILCLKHKQIPPSINVETTNPIIDFPNTPFYVNLESARWPAPAKGTPRRAGVSSFGIGGTNAHVILEEFSEGTRGLAPLPDDENAKTHQLILLSAKSETALRQTTQNLVNHLKENPAVPLSDAAYTLSIGRKAFDHRLALVCRDRDDAIDALETFNPKRILMHTRQQGDKSVVFMFPGIGEHYVNMTFQLYRQEPVFRKHLDHCCDILEPLLKKDLRDILFVEKPGETNKNNEKETINLRKLLNREETPPSEEETLLNRSIYSQTSVFVVEYALARLLMDWGIKPYAMIGYSIGEYTAACLSGVFSLEDALFLVARRAQLIDSIEQGAMLAISLPEKDITPLLPEDISIIAVNTPDLCIVSGKTRDIRSLEEQLKKRKAVFRRLKTFQAFHSPMMEAVRTELTHIFNNVTLHPPTIPYMSNVTGTWISAEQVTTPGYWVTHTVSPIRFSEGIDQLLNTSCNFFLEIGPGNSLCGFTAQHHYSKSETAVDRFVMASLPKESEKVPDEAFLFRALSKLWAAGLEISWSSFYRHQSRKRVPLPPYPFERKRYWLQAENIEKENSPREESYQGTPQEKKKIEDWFYMPAWKLSVPVPTIDATGIKDEDSKKECWLFFLDKDMDMHQSGIGHQVIAQLKKDKNRENIDIIGVAIGKQFEKRSQKGVVEYLIHPGQYEDYVALVGDLKNRDKTIDKIIHIWTLDAPSSFGDLERGVYSLLYLVKAIGRQFMFNPIDLRVVSRGLHIIESGDTCIPENAALLGPCRVIPQEYPNITCRSIDIKGDDMEQNIVSELISLPRERTTAYRGNHRWVQIFEPIKAPKPTGVPGKLRENGVYLIVGGLGNIGFSLAQYLAQSVQAKLILTARSKFPGREQWDHPSEIPDDSTNRKIANIKKLEEMGAEVLVLQADVGNKEQMKRVVNEAEHRFGTLHGVIHAAGLMDERYYKTLTDLERENCETHFTAKIRGLAVLDEVLKDKNPDFCILNSSISSILGGLTLYAYSAASSFMDAFARKQNQVRQTNWLTINWDDWEKEKNQVKITGTPGSGGTLRVLSKTSEEGKEAFKRVLFLKKIPQVIVSMVDLHRLLHQWVLVDNDPGDSDQRETSGAKLAAHQRPQLQSIFEAPQNEAEKIIAEIWQELLAINPIGVHDNFFELGGHSLLATKLISRLREIFRIDLPLNILFDKPTVREVVDNITHTWGDREVVEEIAKTYREVFS